jgi:hypothetical protein
MKNQKTKLLKKLEGLKKKEVTSIALNDESVLDQDIAFEQEDRTQATSQSVSENNNEEQKSVSEQFNITPSSSYSPEEDGTAVLSEVRTFKDDFTQREITAGRNKRDKEKVSYGDVYKVDPLQGDGSAQSVEGLLKQSEHLRLAQEKINELENEIEDLRRENDEIMSVADTFKALSEEYYEQMEKLKEGLIDSRETAQQENRILKDSLQEKDKQLNELKQTNADLKAKVEANFKQIRKRERDLEYRLELIKAEEATLLKTKDKTILDLRRRIDKLDQEMEAYREKNKEHFDKLQQQQQTVRGVVRALRIALTRLEGDFGVDFEVLKKAE